MNLWQREKRWYLEIANAMIQWNSNLEFILHIIFLLVNKLILSAVFIVERHHTIIAHTEG